MARNDQNSRLKLNPRNLWPSTRSSIRMLWPTAPLVLHGDRRASAARSVIMPKPGPDASLVFLERNAALGHLGHAVRQTFHRQRGGVEPLSVPAHPNGGGLLELKARQNIAIDPRPI